MCLRERESIGNFHLNCENKEKAPSALDRYKAEGCIKMRSHLILMHTHVGDVITTHYSHFFTDQRCDNVPRNAEMCQQRQRRGTMQANEHGCDKLQVSEWYKKKNSLSNVLLGKSQHSAHLSWLQGDGGETLNVNRNLVYKGVPCKMYETVC